MDEIGFRTWLASSGKNRKVQADAVSRLKTLQRELGCCDLDNAYSTDGCAKILTALKNKGNSFFIFVFLPLQIGKYASFPSIPLQMRPNA